MQSRWMDWLSAVALVLVLGGLSAAEQLEPRKPVTSHASVEDRSAPL